MEGWEEPLHPGSLVHLYPTLLHKATQFAHDPPPEDTERADSGRIPRPFAGSARWETVGRVTPVSQAGVQVRELHAAVQKPTVFRPVRAL